MLQVLKLSNNNKGVLGKGNKEGQLEKGEKYVE